MIILLYYNLLIIHKQVFKILATIDMTEEDKRWICVKQACNGPMDPLRPIPDDIKYMENIICVKDPDEYSSQNVSRECVCDT